MGFQFTTEKDMVTSETLLRVLNEYNEGYVREMLLLMLPWYGDVVTLSVLSYKNRELLVTTDEEHAKEVERTALSLFGNLGETCFFMRHEQNGIYFREGYNCIRVLPLTVRGITEHFLMVESKSPKAPIKSIRSQLTVLAFAVREQIREEELKKFGKIDYTSKMPNRDALIEDYPQMSADYVVMFTTSDGESIDYILTKQEHVLKTVGNALANRFVIVYKASINSFVYIDHTSKNRYEAASKAQDVLDELMRELPGERIGVSMIPAKVVTDIRTALYLLEKANSQIADGRVTLIREMDNELVGYVNSAMYGYKEKDREEEEEIVYEQSEDMESGTAEEE